MPRPVTVLHYDAFSAVPGKGNPAGVVLDAEEMTDEEMQESATRMGYNETVFVCRSSKADLRLRYFTPGHEMDLCGHGTVATLAALLDERPGQSVRTIETRAGLLSVDARRDERGRARITMSQALAQFEPFAGDRAALAACLGVTNHDLAPRWEPVYGSTGIWTLLVPVKSLEVCRRIVPQNSRFPGILGRFPRASVHPFCLETFHPEAALHGRHFSSPFSRTIEDPVTGTASGVMGAWWLTRMTTDHEVNLVVEQGAEVGRDGLVEVQATRFAERIEVSITGTAVLNVRRVASFKT